MPIIMMLNLKNYVLENIVTCLWIRHGVWIGNWIYLKLAVVINRTGKSIKGENDCVNRKAYNLTKI
jgi:hypothetical protein